MDFPGEKLVIKLWETLAEKGIGSLLKPWHEVRLGKARSRIKHDEILMLAEAEKHAEDIRTGRSAYSKQNEVKILAAPNTGSDTVGRIEPTFDLSDIRSISTDFEVSESIRKEVNVSKAIIVAEDILAQEKRNHLMPTLMMIGYFHGVSTQAEFPHQNCKIYGDGSWQVNLKVPVATHLEH